MIEEKDIALIVERVMDKVAAKYRKIDDCDDISSDLRVSIEKLRNTIAGLNVELAKNNTRLEIIIAILGLIAVPVVSLCVSLLLGR